MLGATFDFAMGPAKPRFTEKELPDQTGKVFVVTGPTAGVGRDLASLLYAAHARVYLAARDAAKAGTAIADITAAHPDSKGDLVFLKLDLADLSGIKASAQEFLAKEQRLDVLWNNAGVMMPQPGTKTAQGYELQLGTNNLGHFLFTKLVQPALERAAKDAPPGSVRVVWVASSAAAAFSPKHGVDMRNLDYASDKPRWHKYGVSKAGNILHGAEFARRFADTGIVSVALDPGNLDTDLYQHVPRLVNRFLSAVVLHPAINGAYTELFAGLSPEVTPDKNGAWIAPFGAFGKLRADIERATRPAPDGGEKSVAQQFWDWSQEQVAKFE